tara:strand:+ start:493 stop:828 length:336 start_codon:yes stop_codon:yes gene_type:complete
MEKLKLKNIISILLLVFGFYYLSLNTPSNKVDACDGREHIEMVRVHFISIAHSVESIQIDKQQDECSYKWYALGYNKRNNLYIHADYITDGSSGKIEIVDLKVSESAWPIR